MASKPQNIFHVKLEEQAVTGTPGILDQFNLPPGAVTFLQKNQRTIWKALGVTAAVVTVVALYGSWLDHTRNKATESYDQAVAIEDEQKRAAALQKVSEDYGSAPAGIWSRIALAHLDQEAGKTKEAIVKLTAIEAEIPAKSPLKPLLLANLGGLHEQEKHFDKAEAAYQQLKGFKGFEPLALSSLGRVQESVGGKDKAVQMYQQYMGLTELGKDKKETGNATARQDFPERELVQASLNRLLK